MLSKFTRVDAFLTHLKREELLVCFRHASQGVVSFDDFCELLDFEDMPDDILVKCP